MFFFRIMYYPEKFMSHEVSKIVLEADSLQANTK